MQRYTKNVLLSLLAAIVITVVILFTLGFMVLWFGLPLWLAIFIIIGIKSWKKTEINKSPTPEKKGAPF